MPISQSPSWFSSGEAGGSGPGPGPGPTPGETSFIWVNGGRGENQVPITNLKSQYSTIQYSNNQSIISETTRNPGDGAPDIGVAPNNDSTAFAILSLSNLPGNGEPEGSVMRAQYSFAAPAENQNLTVDSCCMYGNAPAISGSFHSVANNKDYDYTYLPGQQDRENGRAICIYNEREPGSEPLIQANTFGPYYGWYTMKPWGFEWNGSGYTLTSWVQSIDNSVSQTVNKRLRYWNSQGPVTQGDPCRIFPDQNATNSNSSNLFNAGDGRWILFRCLNNPNNFQVQGSFVEWRQGENIPIANVWGTTNSGDNKLQFNNEVDIHPIIWTNPDTNALTFDRVFCAQSFGYGGTYGPLTTQSCAITGIDWANIEYTASCCLQASVSNIIWTDTTNNALYFAVVNPTFDSLSSVFKITHPSKTLVGRFIGTGSSVSVLQLSETDIMRCPSGAFYEVTTAGYTFEDVSDTVNVSITDGPNLVQVSDGQAFSETDVTFPEAADIADYPREGANPAVQGTLERYLPSEGENQGNVVMYSSSQNYPAYAMTANGESVVFPYYGSSTTSRGSYFAVQTFNSNADTIVDGESISPAVQNWEFTGSSGIGSQSPRLGQGTLVHNDWFYVVGQWPRNTDTYDQRYCVCLVRYNAAGDCELIKEFTDGRRPSGMSSDTLTPPVETADGNAFFFSYGSQGNSVDYNYPVVKMRYDGTVEWIKNRIINQVSYRETLNYLCTDADDNVYAFMKGSRSNDPAINSRNWCHSFDTNGNLRWAKEIYNLPNPIENMTFQNIMSCFCHGDYVYFQPQSGINANVKRWMRLSRATGNVDMNYCYKPTASTEGMFDAMNQITANEFLFVSQGQQNVSTFGRIDVSTTPPTVLWAQSMTGGPKQLNKSFLKPEFFTDDYFVATMAQSGFMKMRTDGNMKYGPLQPLGGYPGYQTYPGNLTFTEADTEGYQENVNDSAFTISDSTVVYQTDFAGPLSPIDPPWEMIGTPYLF